MSHRVGSVTELYELVSRGEIDKAEAMRLAKQLKTAKRAEPAEPAGQPPGSTGTCCGTGSATCSRTRSGSC